MCDAGRRTKEVVIAALFSTPERKRLSRERSVPCLPLALVAHPPSLYLTRSRLQHVVGVVAIPVCLRSEPTTSVEYRVSLPV